MAKANFWQRGENLNYLNSTDSNIDANSIISLTTRIGIAGTDIPAGAEGTVIVEGVFEIPKAAATAIALGDLVYYNEKNDEIDTTDTGVPAGYAVKEAAESDSTVLVKLLG